MTYRKASEESRAWTTWLDQHRAELIGAGLPDFIWEDERRWLRFIEEGYDHETGWKPEWLTTEQREQLRAFVDRNYSNYAGRCMLF